MLIPLLGLFILVFSIVYILLKVRKRNKLFNLYAEDYFNTEFQNMNAEWFYYFLAKEQVKGVSLDEGGQQLDAKYMPEIKTLVLSQFYYKFETTYSVATTIFYAFLIQQIEKKDSIVRFREHYSAIILGLFVISGLLSLLMFIPVFQIVGILFLLVFTCLIGLEIYVSNVLKGSAKKAVTLLRNSNSFDSKTLKKIERLLKSHSHYYTYQMINVLQSVKDKK